MQATKKCSLRSYGRGKKGIKHNGSIVGSMPRWSELGSPGRRAEDVVKEGVKIKLGTHPFRAPRSTLQDRILSQSLAFQDPGLPVHFVEMSPYLA